MDLQQNKSMETILCFAQKRQKNITKTLLLSMVVNYSSVQMTDPKYPTKYYRINSWHSGKKKDDILIFS